MARSRLAAMAFRLLAAPLLLAMALASSALVPSALADGGAGNTLGSLRSIGSTNDLNRPVSGTTSGRVGGIAVDPRDSSSPPRQFNGVVSRIAQGNRAKTDDDAGNAPYAGTANGGVWRTTNFDTAGGNTASTDSRPGIGILKSTDGGRTWSSPAPGGHNTGALQNVGGSNTWSKPATPPGPAALRAKAN